MDADATADQSSPGDTIDAEFRVLEEATTDLSSTGDTGTADPPTDRLFAGVALGLMGLLLLCVVLVLIAWSRG